MPEGDTIFRAARALSRAIAGRTVVRFSSPVVSGAALEGRRITSVDPVGKYLLVRFEGGKVLRTHMKMTGSWHIYRVGERWHRGVTRARAVIETDAYVAVCFDAPVVRLESSRAAERELMGLGPDILSESWDGAAAIARIRGEPRFTMGEALVAQRLVAGIGNIYKSEALFCARIDPRIRVSDIAETDLARVLAEARRLMRANLGPGRRRTRGGKVPYWVYGRAGSPCHVCREPIVRIYQGPLGGRRSTYYCARCQTSA